MVKLIAVDLDGTFFHDRGKISPRNVEALRRARGKGIKTVISTGRVFATSDPKIAPFADAVDYISTCNGAAVYTPGNREALWREGFSPEAAGLLISFFDRERVFYRCYADGCIYYSEESMKSLEQFRDALTTIEGFEGSTFVKRDLAGFLKEKGMEAEKFFLIFKTEDEAQVFRERLPIKEQLFITSSHYNNIELTRAGVDKGTALAYLGNRLHISREEMMAVGDSENDLAMLSYAGVSVAMGNALPKVKELCRYVTEKNTEDGVAKAIERWAL